MSRVRLLIGEILYEVPEMVDITSYPTSDHIFLVGIVGIFVDVVVGIWVDSNATKLLPPPPLLLLLLLLLLSLPHLSPPLARPACQLGVFGLNLKPTPMQDSRRVCVCVRTRASFYRTFYQIFHDFSVKCMLDLFLGTLIFAFFLFRLLAL